VKQLKKLKTELEERNTKITTDYRNISLEKDQLFSDYEDLKNKYFDLEISSEEQIETLTMTLEGFKSATMNTKDLEIKFDAERSALHDEIRFHQGKIKDLEAQVKRLTDENRKIEQQSLLRKQEIEAWKA
jgi:predicted  nucleic acid-binding Zn-ribbon protein